MAIRGERGKRWSDLTVGWRVAPPRAGPAIAPPPPFALVASDEVMLNRQPWAACAPPRCPPLLPPSPHFHKQAYPPPLAALPVGHSTPPPSGTGLQLEPCLLSERRRSVPSGRTDLSKARLRPILSPACRTVRRVSLVRDFLANHRPIGTYEFIVAFP
jgi:hypothetical protein